MPLGASFFEDVPLVEFIYLVDTCMPGGVTIGSSGLCCCVPCLSSAIISLCSLIQSVFICKTDLHLLHSVIVISFLFLKNQYGTLMSHTLV